MARIRRTTTRNTVAGALREYLHFQVRSESDDGFGNITPNGPFKTVFSAYANFRPLLRGSSSGVETVFASQIQGNQPYAITVRRHPKIFEVTTAWRIVDARNEKVIYNIISPPSDPNNADMWCEFVAVKGKPS